MKKYHINKKGVPSLCKAISRNCPFGDASTHFSTKEEAQRYIEKEEEQQHGLLPELTTDNRTEEEKKVAKELLNRALSGEFEEINRNPQKYNKAQLKDLVEKMRSMRDKDGNVNEYLKKLDSDFEEKNKEHEREVELLQKDLRLHSDVGLRLKELEEGIAKNEELLERTNIEFMRANGRARYHNETLRQHRKEFENIVNMKDEKKKVEYQFNKMIEGKTKDMEKEINRIKEERKLVRIMNSTKKRPPIEENPDSVTETERYYRVLEERENES